MNNNYTIDQIHIGDEISYEDKYQSNKFPSWKVISKLDKSLLIIEITDKGFSEQRIIDIMEIENFVVLPKKYFFCLAKVCRTSE